MNQGIGSVKNITPIRYMLYINKIDNAAINKSIKDVAATCADDKTKAQVLISLKAFGDT